jgi:predicted site-specific integrase-resolvase
MRQERMTYQEALQWLCFGRSTLHRWMQQGKLALLSDSQGKHHWFARSAVMLLAQEHTAP